MSRCFPIFLDISNKKIYIYGAGRIASRRAEALLAFSSSVYVFAPEASEWILQAAEKEQLIYKKQVYEPGGIPEDIWMVLAATDDPAVNVKIAEECREKGILVNVCSDSSLCDFYFPGLAMKEDLVIGINTGGRDHQLAKRWTDRIRKEVDADGYCDQTETPSDNGESSENGKRDKDG